MKILHFLKAWWKSISIQENYTMALMYAQQWPLVFHFSQVVRGSSNWIRVRIGYHHASSKGIMEFIHVEMLSSDLDFAGIVFHSWRCLVVSRRGRQPCLYQDREVCATYPVYNISSCLHNLVPFYLIYPFHKSIPQLFAFKNYADISIKIAFTNSEHPKIIRTCLFYERP